MKSILDPKFKYVPSNKTNVRETFKRVRKEMEEKKRQLPDVQKVWQLNNVQR